MKYFLSACFFLIIFSENVFSQKDMQSVDIVVFSDLSAALKQADKVKHLDLSNQQIKITDEQFKKLCNIETLSLRNNNLTEVPHGIIYLSKLRSLDLSNNNIETLPWYIKKLTSLEEIYLNNEVNLNVEQSITVLNVLPKLRSLHLENDHLSTFPKNIFKLNYLENLYLNNNDIKKLPRDIKLPKNLKYIDLKMNKISELIDKENRFGKGIIIKF